MAFYQLARACGYEGRAMTFYREVQDFIPSFFVRSLSTKVEPLFAESLIQHFTRND